MGFLARGGMSAPWFAHGTRGAAIQKTHPPTIPPPPPPPTNNALYVIALGAFVR